MLGKLCSEFSSIPSVLSRKARVLSCCNTSTFCRFLYFEYNEIREVDPGTFDSMPSLQLLFLNANLLRSLPLGVFSGVNLARLNLRNNHFLQLPVAGVLEHLTGLVQVGSLAPLLFRLFVKLGTNCTSSAERQRLSENYWI